MTEQIGGLNIEDDSALREAFRVVSRLRVPVAVHAEDEATIEKAKNKLRLSNRNDIEAFLEAHPEKAEEKAVKRLLKIAKENGTHIHFCHISTKNGLKAIINAKKAKLPITCEATPHHLLLNASDLKRIGMLALTMPPVREKNHIKTLWTGIKNRWIDILGSDHAPHTLKEKTGKTIWDVKVGIPGLETMLPLLLTEVNRGRLGIGDVVRLMSEKPVGIFKLKGKGSLTVGNDADLVVVDLKKKGRIDASKFHSKAKYSPFDDWNFVGKAVKTFVNGQLVADDEKIVAKAGSGNITKRS